MKILLITEFFPTSKDLRFSGGVETRTFFLAKYLAKKHKVIVLTSNLAGSPKKDKISNISVWRVGPKRKYQATTADLVNRLLFIIDCIKFAQKLDVEIVDGANFICHFIARRIASTKNIPCVFWYPDVWVGNWLKYSGLFGIFGELIERINLLIGANAYIGISKSTVNKLKNHLKDKIYLIPCGIDLSEFKQHISTVKPPRIICISRLVKYKRIDILIWAFAALLKRDISAHLVIIGTGPEKKKLTQLAKMLTISDHVSFLGNLPRKTLIKLLKESIVYCLPSEVEGFGISVIESAAAGVPYVVSDIKVFKEITKNGQGGLIFKSGDIKNLSSKIETLLVNKRLYQRKTREAAELAKNYKWQDIAQKTLNIYNTLIH